MNHSESATPTKKRAESAAKRPKGQESEEGRDLAARIAMLVRMLRGLNGMPQKELAENSGVSQGYLSQIESDTRKFHVLATLEAISWELGLKLSELIEFAERPGVPQDLHKKRSKVVDQVLKLDL